MEGHLFGHGRSSTSGAFLRIYFSPFLCTFWRHHYLQQTQRFQPWPTAAFSASKSRVTSAFSAAETSAFSAREQPFCFCVLVLLQQPFILFSLAHAKPSHSPCFCVSLRSVAAAPHKPLELVEHLAFPHRFACTSC